MTLICYDGDDDVDDHDAETRLFVVARFPLFHLQRLLKNKT